MVPQADSTWGESCVQAGLSPLQKTKTFRQFDDFVTFGEGVGGRLSASRDSPEPPPFRVQGNHLDVVRTGGLTARVMLKEFKEFALKGNLVDMAVAFVMGAAFTKLSGSMIEDLVMPLVGKLTGGVDFSNKFIGLSESVTAASLAEARAQGAVFAYGNFITTGINFVIVAFVMFLVVKSINKAKALAIKEEAAAPAAPPEPSAEEKLLTEIRDLLRSRN